VTVRAAALVEGAAAVEVVDGESVVVVVSALSVVVVAGSAMVVVASGRVVVLSVGWPGLAVVVPQATRARVAITVTMRRIAGSFLEGVVSGET
jgi:hypothetical protein